MIPDLDMSLFSSGADRAGFVAELGAAARGPGFFLLSGHGVDTGLIDQIFGQARAFFALPDAQKQALSITRNPHNRGWAAIGTERLDETSSLIDQKEAFNIGFDLPADDPRVVSGAPFRGVNTWPEIDGFRTTMLDYFATVHALGCTLMRAVALDLGQPETRFQKDFDEPMATLRLLSYPASDPGGIGAGAHSDYGALTLLLTDGVAGLQVKPRDGDWMDTPHVPGAFVVNIGDCLMRWSNDFYVSNPHRVLPPKTARQSVAFFLDPNPDAMIAALPGTGAAKYAPLSGADYLSERLSATYG